MDVSILIGTRDDGEALWKTVRSCQESAAGMPHEVIVVDNGSRDESLELLHRHTKGVRLAHCPFAGVAPPRAWAARQAGGEVLLFLDAHTKPEGDAVAQVVQAVREEQGRAIILPRIAPMVREKWHTLRHRAGGCLALDLRTMTYRWANPYDYQRHGGRVESPGLAGGAFALTRETYNLLHGVDFDMRIWGAEDVDLGLRAWLAGYRVLHDPAILVGHCFRPRAETCRPPAPDTIANWMRTAYKSLGQEIWEEWLDQFEPRFERERFQQGWRIFQQRRPSAEAERRYLSRIRRHNAFWFAQRFGLDWPKRDTASAV